MFLTVVVCGVAMTHNGDRGVDWTDYLVTVRHVEDYCGEVGIYVGKLFRRQTHIRFTCVCSNGGAAAAEAEVSHSVQRIADRGHVVTSHLVSRAVIIGGVFVADNGYSDLTLGVDGLATVSNIEGHGVEVGVSVGELSRVQTHAACAGICP